MCAHGLDGLKARASAITRNRLRDATVPLFRSALRTPMQKELQAIREKMGEGLTSLDRWIEGFYVAQALLIARSMEPLVMEYGGKTATLASEEVASSASVPVADFSKQYTEAAGKRWTDSSIAQIRQILRDETDPEQALADRLDKWAAVRPDWASQREATQAGSAFAKLAFLTAGVSKLVWITSSPCDICAPMEGKVVAITSDFVAAGETVNPGGSATPITVEFGIGHPPLHGLDGRGGVCQCTIGAA